MNSLVVVVIALSSILYCGSAITSVNSPIKMCTKADFSLCVDVPYPNMCIDLDTVNMTSDGQRYIDLAYAVQSVVVTDVENNKYRCIVLFDSYHCQGNSLVLDGDVHPAVLLHKFKFANRAVSFRHCSDRLLAHLRDDPSNSDLNDGDKMETNDVELNDAVRNHVEPNPVEPNPVEPVMVRPNKRL